MKIINPSYEILTDIHSYRILGLIERAGRTCYKSETSPTIDGRRSFVRSLIRRGHESVLEHFNISVLFVCNRGFSHELVRHRLASYSQESTRYCNYSQEKFGREITVIEPWWKDKPYNYNKYNCWWLAVKQAEDQYFAILKNRASPQEARGVLPIDLKTEIIMTANLRELRHVLRLRTSKAAHPSMRELMTPLLRELKEKLPVIFDDL